MHRHHVYSLVFYLTNYISFSGGSHEKYHINSNPCCMPYPNGHEYIIGQGKRESIHHRLRVDLDGNKILQKVVTVS